MPLRSSSAPQTEAERRPLQEHAGSTDNAIQLHFLLVRIAVMRTSQSPLKAIFNEPSVFNAVALGLRMRKDHHLGHICVLREPQLVV